MKITELRVSNVKKIKAVQITPDGNIVKITGPNGNGKSSVLDSIVMALGGKKKIPAKPIREGEDKAEVIVDTGEYVFRRHWTGEDKTYLTMTNKDGAKITNAQGIIDKLVGNLSFDPLAFANLEPIKRERVIKDITGLEFDDLDKEYKTKFEERRDVARDGEKIKARLEEFNDLEDLPEEQVKIDAVKEQRSEAEKVNRDIDSAEREAKELESDITVHESDIRVYEDQIQDLQKKIEFAKKSIDEHKKTIKEKRLLAKKPKEDLSKFDELIEQYYNYNSLEEKHQQKAKVQSERDELAKKWNELNDRLNEIKQEKEDRIKAVKMPIDGLSIDGKDVYFNGVPFEQLCSAERIKVSMSIAIAMNPKLRLAMIYDGSLLDKKSMEYIAQIADEKDVQVWIERVADGPEANSIYIEDGMIANG